MGDFLYIIQVIAAFNFLFIGTIIILNKSRVTYGVKILAFFLLAKGITLSTNLYYYHQWSLPKEIIEVFNSALFFYAPLLYFFSRYVVKKQVFTLKRDIYHFAPFFIYLFLNIVGIFYSIESLILENIVSILYYTQAITYTLFSYYLIHTKGESSKIQIWIKNLLVCFLLVWVMFLTVRLSFSFGYKTLSYIFKVLGVITLLILANFTIAIAIFSPDIFYKGLRVIRKSKNENIILTKENYNKIVQVMSENMLYTNSNLKLVDLANEVGFTERNTSLLIKHFYQSNFYEFVNSFRIEQAKKLFIEEQDSLTIAEVLYDVGFNSKSVFNTTFKKKVGMTPSEYKKSIA